MKNFYPFLKPYKAQFVVGPLFKLIEAILELTLPVQMAIIIDQGVALGNTDVIYQTGLRMLLTIVVGLISALICQYLAAVASQGFGTRVRSAMFSHVNRFSQATFDRFGTDTLTTRMTNDINQLQVAVAMTIRLLVRAPFVSIGCIVAAMLLDVPLAVIVVVAVALFILVMVAVMKAAYPLYGEVQKRLDGVGGLVRENCSGVRVIRAFARGDAERGRFRAAVLRHSDSVIRVMRVSSLMNPLTMLIMNISVAAILWFGAGRVNAGDLQTGTIIAFINYMAQILNALIAVAHLVVIFTRTAASYTRVDEVLSTPEDPASELADALRVDESSSSPSLEKFRSDSAESTNEIDEGVAVAFRDVMFSYSDSGGGDREKDALSGISFSVARGGVLGIIGGTGSGKSTILSLLEGFYSVREGRIHLFGREIGSIPRDELRGMIGAVFQEPVIFTGTVADNLRWGKADATEQELWQALQAAQADAFVERMPEKLLTHVVRGAKNLSGGQKQRLSIARALVRRPRILLLDDASSALDYTTEAKLRKSLAELSRETGMTMMIVSQRIAALRNADTILVLDDGQQVGLGSHSELLRTCPTYRSIALSQLAEEEVGA